MKILKTTKLLKCDTVGCNTNSQYELILGSYKGNIYLCKNCYTELKNLFTKEQKNETKK